LDTCAEGEAVRPTMTVSVETGTDLAIGFYVIDGGDVQDAVAAR
jgi:hypothetical protein